MIRGICSSHYPDYALIVVDAKAGLTKIAIDHFNLAFAFKVPIIIVMTKIDQVNENKLFETKNEISELTKKVTGRITVEIN